LRVPRLFLMAFLYHLFCLRGSSRCDSVGATLLSLPLLISRFAHLPFMPPYFFYLILVTRPFVNTSRPTFFIGPPPPTGPLFLGLEQSTTCDTIMFSESLVLQTPVPGPNCPLQGQKGAFLVPPLLAWCFSLTFKPYSWLVEPNCRPTLDGSVVTFFSRREPLPFSCPLKMKFLFFLTANCLFFDRALDLEGRSTPLEGLPFRCPSACL